MSERKASNSSMFCDAADSLKSGCRSYECCKKAEEESDAETLNLSGASLAIAAVAAAAACAGPVL